MILKTKRLWLREMNSKDFEALCRILQDEDVMYAYEHAFHDEEVSDWLNHQLERYNKEGYGLWAVIHKETGKMIGQCGLTSQKVRDKNMMEIGYLFQKACWHQGYAIEAARACKEYAFHTYPIEQICSIIRDSNLPSKKVAIKNGMSVKDHIVKHYYGIDMPHDVYILTRYEYEKQKMK